jgi:hypothetical protein
MTKTKNKTAKRSKATALHISANDGKLHGVAIRNLHVLLMKEGDFWVAQGLDLDYVVQGDSIEEAKRNFQVGLEATVDLNLRMFGNIESLVMSHPPSEALLEAAQHKDSIALYTQVTTHDIGPKSQKALPFDGVRFLTFDSTEEAA